MKRAKRLSGFVALAGFVWACGGEMKPAAHPKAHPEGPNMNPLSKNPPPGNASPKKMSSDNTPSNNTPTKGGPRMLSDARIKKALAAEKEIALIRILDIREKGQGTRSYGTEYKIAVLESMPDKTAKKTCGHWGAPVLAKGGLYVVAMDPFEQSWATDKDAFLQTTEAEADAVFRAHREKAESFLNSGDVLPDSVLEAALAGETSIVLANLNLGAGSTEGVAPGAPWNCLMYVKETLAGPAKGNFTVPIQGPVNILPGTDYILSVRPKEAGPQALIAVEVFPANRERRVKLHKDRLSALRKK